MSKQIDALKLALEALEEAWYHVGTFCPTDEAIELYDDARAAIKEALAQPEQTNTRPYYTIDELNAWADEKENQAWRNAAIRIGEELSSVGPDGYYDMDAWKWLDWAMEQEPRGKNSLAQTEQEPVAWIEHHKGGDNLNWEEVNHPYAKATPLYTTPPQPEKLDQDEVDIRSRLYQRIHELETQLAQPEDKKCENCGEFGECCQLARGEQEPVAFEAFNAWMHYNLPVGTVIGHSGWWADKIYSRFMKNTTPPQRTWVGLTDEEMQAVVDKQPLVSSINVYFKAIEAKLKQKNGYAEEKNT